MADRSSTRLDVQHQECHVFGIPGAGVRVTDGRRLHHAAIFAFHRNSCGLGALQFVAKIHCVRIFYSVADIHWLLPLALVLHSRDGILVLHRF
ncbi:hypothetical protein SUGI_0255180 [Cryptomeria japonica]|nr:hypothetical protein SUGI_0255180 [Cryptomeria japonica]